MIFEGVFCQMTFGMRCARTGCMYTPKAQGKVSYLVSLLRHTHEQWGKLMLTYELCLRLLVRLRMTT